MAILVPAVIVFDLWKRGFYSLMLRCNTRSIICQTPHLSVVLLLVVCVTVHTDFVVLLTGVWTRETIPVRTCFGPLIGQQSHSMEVADWTDKATNHIWKVSICFPKSCAIVKVASVLFLSRTWIQSSSSSTQKWGLYWLFIEICTVGPMPGHRCQLILREVYTTSWTWHVTEHVSVNS